MNKQNENEKKNDRLKIKTEQAHSKNAKLAALIDTSCQNVMFLPVFI
jgi:hypothetical protein